MFCPEESELLDLEVLLITTSGDQSIHNQRTQAPVLFSCRLRKHN
jgi:hypothetical protein